MTKQTEDIAGQFGVATAAAVSGEPVNVANLRAALHLAAAQIECAASMARRCATESQTYGENCATAAARRAHLDKAEGYRCAAASFDRTAAAARMIAEAPVMGLDASERVATWLRSIPQTFDVVPTRITIGRTVYPGAFYKQHCEAPAGCRNPGPYIRESVYLLGPLPAAYRRTHRIAFEMPGDKRAWFVASYITPEIISGLDSDKRRFHPFGAMLQLAPWDAPGAIDEGVKPYRRLQLTKESPQ